MTDSAYHCGNCPNREINPNDDWFCKVDGEGLAGEIEVETTKRYGCLSHPLAQAAMREEGAKQEREQVLASLTAVFEAFEDRKRFAYSANDIIEYIDNFRKLESLRGQHESKGEPE